MKHFIVILSVLALSTFASAQQTDDVYYQLSKTYNATPGVYTISENVNPALNAAKIEHVNYCLQRFKDQQFMAMGVSFLAGMVAGFGPSIMDDNLIPYYAGGLSLVGIGIYIDSYKWLQRASIEPTREGLTFRFKF